MIPDAFLSRRDPDSLRRTLRAGSETDALKFHSNDGMLNPQCGPCSRASSHPSGALWGDAICRLGTVMHQRSGLWTEGELPSQREHVESAQHQAPRETYQKHPLSSAHPRFISSFLHPSISLRNTSIISIDFEHTHIIESPQPPTSTRTSLPPNPRPPKLAHENHPR